MKSFSTFFFNVETPRTIRAENYTTINYDASLASSKCAGVDIDDYLAQFSNDPEATEALQRGAQWVGEQYYPNPDSIKSLRLKKGLSQQQLADLIESQQSYISRLETNGCDDLRISTVKKLAKALGVDAEVIFNIV